MNENNQLEVVKESQDSYYVSVLDDVQEFISKRYGEDLSSDNRENKNLLLEYIRRYVMENNVMDNFKNTDISSFVKKIYWDMAAYGFLTPLLNRTDIEEINVNAWNCVKIVMRDGSKRTVCDGFPSKQHANNIIGRLLRKSGGVIDESKPIGNAHLNSNIRIIATQAPIVRDDDGICASIRFVSPVTQTKQVMLNTASPEMLKFLETCLKYGTNIMVGGETGSGKTNTMVYLVSTLDDNCRIVSIEEGSREMDLRKYDSRGNVKNDIVQFLTREHENESLCITQSDCLRTALRYNPDVIVMGEVRSKESFAAQEAARTHTVISTCHANNSLGVYDRLVSMAKQMMDYNDEYLLKLMVAAFPIIVFQKRWNEDNSRRISAILEGVEVENGNVVYRMLYKFNVTNIDENGRVNGEFVKVGNLSEKNIDIWRQNGIPKNLLDELTGGAEQ